MLEKLVLAITFTSTCVFARAGEPVVAQAWGNPAVLKVQSQDDYIKVNGVRITDNEIPGIESLHGMDDVIYNAKKQTILVGTKDRHIYQINLRNKTIEHLAKTPLSPAGMKVSPSNSNILYFCALRFFGDGQSYDNIPYEDASLPGLYSLNLKTKKLKAVLNFLPTLAQSQQINSQFDMKQLNAENGRLLEICNDLDISPDGKRIYLIETDQEPTENGPPAVKQIVTRAKDGKVWKVDLAAQTLSQIGNGYAFADGILLDIDKRTKREKGVFFTELAKFQILEINLNSNFAATTTDVVIDNLPGLPDGMDRDENGNIHVALFKDVTPTVLYLQAHPEELAKLVGLPYDQLPLPKQTGMLILDPTGRIPLFYTMHDASFVKEVPALSAAGGKIFFSSFSDDSKGLYFVDSPMTCNSK